MPVEAVGKGPTYIQRGARINKIVKIVNHHRKWVADKDSQREAKQDADPGIDPGSLLAPWGFQAHRLELLRIHAAP